MKTKVIIMMSLFISLFLTGCEKELVEVPGEVPGQLPPEGKPSDLPDGYFEVTFSAGYGGGDTRTPVTGTDSRVRHLRYVIYKSTGEFVKEKVVLNTTDAAPSWPMAALKDTLPKGYSIEVFSKQHDQVEAKLGELKNILIKYYPAESSNELNSVLFDIFTCEEDLASHNYIEDALFIPAIKKLEQERSKNV